MKTYTAAQVREAEEPYLRAGVPLMQRASAALAAEIAALLTDRRGAVAGARVLVLAGAGNNGGDALYAVSTLLGSGATVTVLATASKVHEEALAAARAAGADLLSGTAAPQQVAEAARESDVIVDGILGTGTGAQPALRGRARDLVSAIRTVLRAGQRPWVVAVDLPSGIGPDDGSVPDPTVLPADLTVTFGGCKAGLVREPAASLSGRVVVVDIGIAEELARIADRDRR